MKFTILLYYQYVHLFDPRALVGWHKGFCSAKDLKGRIIVAEEGLNGTLEGRTEDTEAYIKALIAYEDIDQNGGRHRPFKDIVFKISEGDGEAFPKLSVRLRKEIVSLHLGEEGDIDPTKLTGTHLKPKELRKWFEEGKDFTIVDMRNDYEYKVGYFKDSINPKLENFRDVPKVLSNLAHLKEKPVLTVCTGGVRCEKASGYLKSQGFKDVYQLDGGIVSYMNAYPGKDFLGALYVFDKRVTMDTTKDREIVGKCDVCSGKTEKYINCSQCHKHVLFCDKCTVECGGAYCGQCAPVRV